MVDDGSTDDTSERVKRYKDRVKYIHQRNSGKAGATKVGIDIARGKYIFNLDADDLFLPDKIQKVVSIFEKDGDIIHIGHPAICWRADDNIWEIESIPDHIKWHKIYGRDLLSYFYMRQMLFGGGSTFAGRADMLKMIPIKKAIDMYIDEYLVLSALNRGYTFFIGEPLSIWRIHGKNYSYKNPGENRIERTMSSMEAVLSEVMNNDFSEKLRILYQLKARVSRIAAKETLSKKSFLDIMDLWLYFLKNYRIWGKDILIVIESYNLINRTLPTFLLSRLRRIKARNSLKL